MLDQVLRDLGLETAAAAFRIGERWKEVVGPEIALHSRPEGLRGDTLEVSVDSSVWCQQLQLRRLDILAALHEALGEEAPRDLRFSVGRVPGA